MYNLTGLKAADTIPKLVVYANDITGDVLMNLFLWATFMIMFMVMKRFDFDESLLTSSFVTFILALIFNYIGLIPLKNALVFLVIVAFGAFYSFVLKK